jgi:hypothetical protein
MKNLRIIIVILLSFVLLHAQDTSLTTHNGVVYNREIPTNCTNGMNYNGISFLCAPAIVGIPSGAILIINTGSCPAGFTEVTGLDGKMPLGTLVAHSDIGTTGGPMVGNLYISAEQVQ